MEQTHPIYLDALFLESSRAIWVSYSWSMCSKNNGKIDKGPSIGMICNYVIAIKVQFNLTYANKFYKFLFMVAFSKLDNYI